MAAKVGIYDAIVACLTKANAKKPATRQDIITFLTEEFPDRDPAQMSKTVSAAVGWAIETRRGLKVSKGGRGEYWIDSTKSKKTKVA